MTDYISREEALKAISVAELGMEYESVEKLPAADVRPVVRGKWIKTEIRAPFDQDEFTCSVCRSWPWWCGVTDTNLPNFCPNCGASMVGVGE